MFFKLCELLEMTCSLFSATSHSHGKGILKVLFLAVSHDKNIVFTLKMSVFYILISLATFRGPSYSLSLVSLFMQNLILSFSTFIVSLGFVTWISLMKL